MVISAQVAPEGTKTPEAKILPAAEQVGKNFTGGGADGDVAAELAKFQVEAEVNYDGPKTSKAELPAKPVDVLGLDEEPERRGVKRGRDEPAVPAMSQKDLEALIAAKAEEIIRNQFQRDSGASSSSSGRKTFVQDANAELKAGRDRKRRSRQHKGRKPKKSRKHSDSEDDGESSGQSTSGSTGSSVFREARERSKMDAAECDLVAVPERL